MAKLKTVASFIFNFPYGENLILVYLIMTNIKIILILQTQQEGRRKVNFFFFFFKKRKVYKRKVDESGQPSKVSGGGRK